MKISIQMEKARFNVWRKKVRYCSQCRKNIKLADIRIIKRKGIGYKYCQDGHRVRIKARTRDRNVGIKRL